MSDTNLVSSDDDLERQIAALADAAFAETQPVTASSSSFRRGGHGWGHRASLVAAVVLVALAVGGFAWLVGRPATNTDPIGDSDQRRRTIADDGTGQSRFDGEEDSVQQLPDAAVSSEMLINDPLNIDLDELVAISDQNNLRRLDEPITTIGFADLPPGWSVTGEEVDIARHFSGKPSVSHVMTLDGPGPLRAVVDVDAAWESGVVTYAPVVGSQVKQLDIGGSTAAYDLNRLSWMIDDRLALNLFVSAESDIANTEAELIELAEAITPIERQLAPATVPNPAGPSLAGEDVLLAGRIDGSPWAVVAVRNDWFRVGYGADLAGLGQITMQGEMVSLADDVAADGSRAKYVVQAATANLPGGVLWFGTLSEPDATLVVFFENGEAVLPTVPHGSGSAFAVPLDHRLDAVEVIFSGADGERLLTEVFEDDIGSVEFTEP